VLIPTLSAISRTVKRGSSRNINAFTESFLLLKCVVHFFLYFMIINQSINQFIVSSS
jgi:hypothetical protein